MQIIKDKVASIDYTLTGDDGAVIDTSDGRGPLEYIHGQGRIIPGLEEALNGRSVGESFKISIPAGEAYGEHDENLIQPVPRANFGGIEKIEVGMRFHARTPHGAQEVKVVKVDDQHVTIDANHPLAGQTLHFAVKVIGVRDAKPEELEHQHVCHSEGGCDGCCGGH